MQQQYLECFWNLTNDGMLNLLSVFVVLGWLHYIFDKDINVCNITTKHEWIRVYSNMPGNNIGWDNRGL